MSTVLDRLHDDHRNMVRLLDFLDAEVEDLAAGRDHDYQLLADAVNYFNHYPATSHHPVEDQIFQWLARWRPDLTSLVDELRLDHEEQGKQVRQMAVFMQGIVSGHMVPRQRIVDELRQFSAGQRDHINKEESKLLKETEKLLRERELGDVPLVERDPLFGGEIESEYADLFEALND